MILQVCLKSHTEILSQVCLKSYTETISQDVSEHPLPDSAPAVPYDPVNQTIYDNGAMEMTQIDNSIQESAPDDFGESEIIDKMKAVNFLQNLFSKPEYASLGKGEQRGSDDTQEVERCDREVNFYTSKYVPQTSNSEDITGRREPVAVRGLSGRSPLMCIQSLEQEDVTETDLTDHQSPEKVADHKSFLSRLKGEKMGPVMIVKPSNATVVDKTVIFGQEGENDMDHTEPIKDIAIEVNKSASRSVTRNSGNVTKIFHSNNDMEQTTVLSTTHAPNDSRTAPASGDGQFTQYFERNQTMEITANFTSRIRMGDRSNLNLTTGGPNAAGDLSTGLTADIGHFNMNKTVAFDNDDMEETKLFSEVHGVNNREVASNADLKENLPVVQEVPSIMNNVHMTKIFSSDNMEETRMLMSGNVIDNRQVNKTMNLDENMEETRLLTSGHLIDNMKEIANLTGGNVSSNKQVNKTVMLNDNMEETRMLTSGNLIDKMKETTNLTRGNVSNNKQVNKTIMLNDNMEETRMLTSGDLIDKMKETTNLTGGNVSNNKQVNKTIMLNDNMEETRMLTSVNVIDNNRVNKTMTFNDNMDETRPLTSCFSSAASSNDCKDLPTDLNSETNLHSSISSLEKNEDGNIAEKRLSARRKSFANKGMNVTTYSDNMEETLALSNATTSVTPKDANLTRYSSKMEETLPLEMVSKLSSNKSVGNKTVSSIVDNMEETRMLTNGTFFVAEKSGAKSADQNDQIEAVSNENNRAEVRASSELSRSEVDQGMKNQCEVQARENTEMENATVNERAGPDGSHISTTLIEKTNVTSKFESVNEPTEVIKAKYAKFLQDMKKNRIETAGPDSEFADLGLDDETSEVTFKFMAKTGQKRRSTVRLSTASKMPNLTVEEKKEEGLEINTEDNTKRDEIDRRKEEKMEENDKREEGQETVARDEVPKIGSNSSIPNLDEIQDNLLSELAPDMLTHALMDTDLLSLHGDDNTHTVQRLRHLIDQPTSSSKQDKSSVSSTNSEINNGGLPLSDKDTSHIETGNISAMSMDTTTLLAHHTGLTTQVIPPSIMVSSQQDGAPNIVNSQQNGEVNTLPTSSVNNQLASSVSSQQTSSVDDQCNNMDTDQKADLEHNRQTNTVTIQESNALQNQLNSTATSQYTCNYTTRSSSSEDSQLQETAQSLMASMSTNMIKILDDWEEEEEEFDGPMTIENFCTKFLKVPLPCQFWRNSNKRRRSSIASAPVELECGDVWSELGASVIHGSYVEACHKILQEALANADCRARDREKFEERFLSDPPDWVKEALTVTSEEGKLQLKEKVAELSSMCNSMARKLHHKEIKYQASTAYCNILQNKLEELKNKLQIKSEVSAKAKEFLDSLNEEEARLDDILSAGTNEEVSMEDASTEIEENKKKMDELEELEQRAGKSDNKLSQLRLESTDKEEDVDFSTEREVLQADINTLENLTEWIWQREESDEESELFLFYDGTLAVIIDKVPGSTNGNIKIRKIQLYSLLEDDNECTPSSIDLMKMAKVKIAHNLLMKAINTDKLCEKYKSWDSLPDLLHELSITIIDTKTLISDLDRAGLIDNILLTWNISECCAIYDKWSLTQLRKITITIKLIVEGQSVKTVPQVHVKYGKFSNQDVMKVIQKVDQGVNYAERLCQAIDLEDLDSLPDYCST
ncbi:hypothetical protein FSP39_024766 [Pinctada imbricata]|uniref:Uncharacterized protein n=1 Tax=Pinctada imbricata TaxID=66713 RepID=A0AA88YNJ1_PINIB|nr:hypothetical protein FSP39_024766 [Pinctada imbricata]